MTTTVATAVASFVYAGGMDTRGQAERAGLLLGGCGRAGGDHACVRFVTVKGAFLIGIAAGLIPWFFCFKVKGWFGYDDALDTFGVHAVGADAGSAADGIPGAQRGERETWRRT
ncbi:MAG: hypothetical protein U1F98_06530 [Verrucomicrobiota bacterium]